MSFFFFFFFCYALFELVVGVSVFDTARLFCLLATC